jgi:nucleoside-diphosphate-sugar epimerase
MTRTIGIFGATSIVGRYLISEIQRSDFSVLAFSRNPPSQESSGVSWVQCSTSSDCKTTNTMGIDMSLWISLLPIWSLPQYFPLMIQAGVKRVVILSSTSRFTKVDSLYKEDRHLTERLISAEEDVRSWSKKNNIEITILYPTLIYDCFRDGNVSEIARFIEKFKFFPLLGNACGLRQPVHADDVALACFNALFRSNLRQEYYLSGGETLTYRKMVERIFLGLDLSVRFLFIPSPLFRVAVCCACIFGKKISFGMIARMQDNLIFDHFNATEDLEFQPRPFKYDKI